MRASPLQLFTKSVAILAIAAGTAMSVLLCWSAFHTNGAFGFPLDDSWIHLQFARNLAEYGSFSYYRDAMVTSGSTSPLYTVLLAAGFLVTSHEYILSYVLGIGFFAAGAVVLWRLGLSLFRGETILIVAAILLYFLDPRLQWIALSGMETTLFIFLLLLVWHLYRIKSARWLGVAAGLLLWTRPEAIVLFAALALDMLYERRWVKHAHPKKRTREPQAQDYGWPRPALLIAGIIWLGYGAFHWILSGSLLPNTYAAKSTYYASGGAGFPRATLDFLTAHHMEVLAAFSAVALIDVLWKIIRRKPQDLLVPVLWSAGLFAAYWHTLPFLYQEGRYLMPLLPWMIILGVRGIQIALGAIQALIPVLKNSTVHTAVLGIAALVLLVQSGRGAWERRDVYADYCKYISDRQVRTAFWIRDHLPADAVIGTHDVGAIAYYSGRRIVDMVGLVSPEMIQHIGSFDRLVGFLGRSGVTHLAVLRNWFEVTNQNPLFTTDERTPEIMEVFAFDPARCHFTPQSAGELVARGAYALRVGDVQTGGAMLEQALRIDPRSARAHYHFGVALLGIGKEEEAERAIRTALDLHPDAWPAKLALAHFALKRGEAERALAMYKEVEERNPSYAPAYKALADFYLAEKKDTAASRAYMQKYAELTGESKR